MNELKFSIIIPSLNQGIYLEQSISSVLNQGYKNLELIVIDGKSTDCTLEILKKYQDKLKWISEKDSGQSDAINKGLKMATGDVIGWLNTDDYYMPGALQKVSDSFTNNKSSKWVTGDCKIVNSEGKEIQKYVALYKKILRQVPKKKMLLFANFIAEPSTFWRRNIVEEIGYFNTKLKYVMDYEYWLRIISKYPLSILNEELSAFRIHSESKGGSAYIKQFKEQELVFLEYQKTGLLSFLYKLNKKLTVEIYKIIKK